MHVLVEVGDVLGQTGVDVVKLRVVEDIEGLERAAACSAPRRRPGAKFLKTERSVTLIPGRRMSERGCGPGVDVRDADLRVSRRPPLARVDLRLGVAGDDRARPFGPRPADPLVEVDVRDAEAEFGRLARNELCDRR